MAHIWKYDASYLVNFNTVLLSCSNMFLGQPQWIQACFSKLYIISAVALQGLGYWNDARIEAYSLFYGYNKGVAGIQYMLNDNITVRKDEKIIYFKRNDLI